MSLRVMFLAGALMSFSCHADSVWQPIATHATMLAMVLFINLVFLGSLYVLAITKGKRHRALLETQVQEAQIDFLTQVLNRRGFERRITDKRYLKGYILIVDIDDFKRINDQYGHHSGDLILQEVTARLKEALREEDMIARFGGEEFVIYAALQNKHSAQELSCRLVSAISANKYPLPGADEPLSVTISVGVASVLDSLNVSDVTSRKGVLSSAFKIADSNLYKAKRLGKNQSVMN
ncbi:MAG: hypothetical protein CL586_07700 [Alteromonadaceae bacterium]|nr:hypothetical protein [Alteromonadaceae bacterium]|tara:strand:+ start:528 stop:1235 length:708 start_codon:yes stop_codon:yes gene_type:complete